MKKKIGIIGLGNPLRGDDGIGLVLLKYLQNHKEKLTKNIDFIDGGTSGMNLVHLLGNYDSVFVLDAVDFHGTPGELKTFTVEEVKNQKIQFFLSTHEPDFLSVLTLLQQINKVPTQLLIFGVQPKEISYKTGFSNEIQTALPMIQKKIFKEIQSLTKC